MKTQASAKSSLLLGAAALLVGVSLANAQGGGGQGGLSPDTPVLSPNPPGPSGGTQPAGPKTPLPPRDTPRAAQPGQNAGGGGPATPLPPRDTPRAQQPGQRTAAAPDPDWPCVQVKVPTLSYGQMWAGPPLDDALKAWRDEKKLGDVVDALVARRTKMDEAKTIIDEFAKDSGDEADKKLTLLFAGVFDDLNSLRSQIMSGIERYSRKQRELADSIKTESLRIAAKPQDMATQNSPEALKEQETLNWQTRIYEERSQSVNYVCETPVILEQRAFDLGREIQSHLKQSQ